MSHQARFAIFLIVIAIIVAIILYKVFYKGGKEIKQLKIKYDQAIKNKDKALALELGRKYYSALRMGQLTIYDEQAITNDLSTI
jgi:hypothetical protein